MSALLACQATASSRGREVWREGDVDERKKGEPAKEGGARGSEVWVRHR